MKNILIIAAIGCAALFNVHSASAQEKNACAPAGKLHFVCGVKNPEDLQLIPKTRWIIASGMAEDGGLHVIDTKTKTLQPLYSGPAAKTQFDKAMYGACPGPLDPSKSVVHGLGLRSGSDGRLTLYAVNHGGREAIEVFTIDASGAIPAATWIGCVTMPSGLAANSVTSFSDGSILATVLMLPGKTFGDSIAGRNTGAVYSWKPGSEEFKRLLGTELPGNNGIDVSPDGTEFYVVSSGLRRVVAFSRADSSKPLRFVQFKDFTPDNVHWTSDGRLISAGMIDDEPACGGPPSGDAKGAVNLTGCPRGFIAAVFDPKTMVATEVVRNPANPAFTGATIAVPVAGEVWIGSFHADRVAYRSLK